MGVVNMAKLLGRGLNLYQPGLGDEALAYSNTIEEEMAQRLTQAAQDGARIDITGWDAGLPTPDEVRKQIAQVPVMEIPEPPPLARHSNAAEAGEESASQDGGR